MLKANITSIQHFNVHDGPGIRTVVFFQGCSLKCRWCQNPETISAKPRIMFSPRLCIGCMACVDACKNHALAVKDQIITYDPGACRLCRSCEAECFAKARTVSSREMTLEEVFGEVMKDAVVYRRSGGGVTVSGGEPLLQADFNTALFQRLKDAGVGTAVETAGNVPWEALASVAPCTDTFLFDFKLFDPEKHRRWTGADNARIRENLIRICEIHPNVVVRIPLIPTVNDTDEEFTDMMRFVRKLRKINSVHILPFHKFGSDKYEMLGESCELAEFPEENAERIEACTGLAKDYGIKVNLGGTGFAEDKRKGEKRC